MGTPLATQPASALVSPCRERVAAILGLILSGFMFFEDRDLEDKSIELSTETEAIPNHFVGNHNMIVDPELEQSQKTPSAMPSV